MIKNYLFIKTCFAISLLVSCQSVSFAIDCDDPRSFQFEMPVGNNSDDSDNDGVVDSQDYCHETPAHLVVDATGCPFNVSIPEESSLSVELRVFYDENSSDIKIQYYKELDKTANYLKHHPLKGLIVEGHASAVEISDDDYTLSLSRAQSVANFLMANYDIDPERISTVGYGATRPIAPNDSIEGRAVNQRVHAVINSRTTNITSHEQFVARLKESPLWDKVSESNQALNWLSLDSLNGSLYVLEYNSSDVSQIDSIHYTVNNTEIRNNGGYRHLLSEQEKNAMIEVINLVLDDRAIATELLETLYNEYLIKVENNDIHVYDQNYFRVFRVYNGMLFEMIGIHTVNHPIEKCNISMLSTLSID